MIKHLPISPVHRQHIQTFTRYLKTLGFSGSAQMGGAVKELLYRMELEGKSLYQISAEDIRRHYEYLLNRPNYRDAGGLSLYTINNYIYALKLFFSYAEKTELIGQNPMSTLTFSFRPEGQRQVLTPSEINELYKACRSAQERAIIGLFYGCGLRRMEAEKLNMRDVDFNNRYLYVRSGKGRKRRAVPMIERVISDFKQYTYREKPPQISFRIRSEDKKAFMLNAAGTRMRGQSYWLYFKRILQRSLVDKQVSLHHLRHSIATHLLAGGMGIEQVRDFLGHQALETTQGYTRVSQNQLR